jgi:hypothetical protein
MPPWHVGNANDDSDEHRGWLIGHFKPTDDIRQSKDVEVKWGIHPAGDARTEWSPGIHAGTALILSTGRWQLNLRQPGQTDIEAITLEHPGDYAVWGPGVDHIWHALEDSTVVTVRWPSSVKSAPGRQLAF